MAAWPLDRLPSGYRTQAEDAGAVLLEAGTDRLGPGPRDLRAIGLRRPVRPGRRRARRGADRGRDDFLALGTAALDGSAT